MPKQEPQEQVKDERQIDLVDNPPERRTTPRNGEADAKPLVHPAPAARYELQATPAPVAGPMQMMQAALASGMTPDQMERLLAVQQQWEANEARKAFVADMAEFKKNPPQIVKDKLVGYENKDGSFTGYKHATLGNVTNAVVEGLAAHGFSHNWTVLQENGQITVTCRITHRMGHVESVSMTGAKDDSGKKNAIQQVASTISYLQRYTLLASCGLATHDQADDDGQAAGLDVALADKWLMQADAATSLEELEKAWKAGLAEIRAAGDTHAYNELKAKVTARREELAGAA